MDLTSISRILPAAHRERNGEILANLLRLWEVNA